MNNPLNEDLKHKSVNKDRNVDGDTQKISLDNNVMLDTLDNELLYITDVLLDIHRIYYGSDNLLSTVEILHKKKNVFSNLSFCVHNNLQVLQEVIKMYGGTIEKNFRMCDFYVVKGGNRCENFLLEIEYFSKKNNLITVLDEWIYQCVYSLQLTEPKNYILCDYSAKDDVEKDLSEINKFIDDFDQSISSEEENSSTSSIL